MLVTITETFKTDVCIAKIYMVAQNCGMIFVLHAMLLNEKDIVAYQRNICVAILNFIVNKFEIQYAHTFPHFSLTLINPMLTSLPKG